VRRAEHVDPGRARVVPPRTKRFR